VIIQDVFDHRGDFHFSILQLKRSSRVIGLCYVVVKVALLLVIEILAFPVICGWWLDICSLSLFDASLKVCSVVNLI
jgi:hypothetical protein